MARILPAASFVGGEGFGLKVLPLIWVVLYRRRGIELTFLLAIGNLWSQILKVLIAHPRPGYFDLDLP